MPLLLPDSATAQINKFLVYEEAHMPNHKMPSNACYASVPSNSKERTMNYNKWKLIVHFKYAGCLMLNFINLNVTELRQLISLGKGESKCHNGNIFIYLRVSKVMQHQNIRKSKNQ